MSSLPPKRSVIADLEAALGADRAFALQNMPTTVRPAVEALWRLDAAMGDVVARSSDPMLARIKLAWWREQLEALDERTPPAEPRLRAVAEHILPRGITGSELGQLEPGWATLLDDPVDAGLVSRRGENLFNIAGRLLPGTGPRLEEAGALHALVSVGRRGVPELLLVAREIADGLKGHRFPPKVRALTMLSRASARDLARATEPEGSPRRLLAMLAHRWTGKI